MNVVREDPRAKEVLYVGTDRGVYVSLDKGASWASLGRGIPNVPVHDLRVHPRARELVAATHGRSVWILDVAPLQTLARERGALSLLKPASITGSGVLRRRPSRWRPAAAPKTHPLYIWSEGEAKGRIDIVWPKRKGFGEAVLRTLDVELRAGLNRIDWDRQIDEAKALAAEAVRLKARNHQPEAAGARGSRPWSEAKRLGQPIGLLEGDYTIRLTVGETKLEKLITVK